MTTPITTAPVDVRSRRALRSVAAVVAGLLAIVALSTAVDAVMHATGVFPPFGQAMSDGRFVLATAYRIVISIAGCALAARLAPNRPMRHALSLGVVGAIVSLAGAVATWNAGPELGPKWYPLLLVAVAVPCAFAGGRLEAVSPSRTSS